MSIFLVNQLNMYISMYINLYYTWLYELDIEYLFHMSVVGCDLEDGVRGVLYAGDVDRYHVI